MTSFNFAQKPYKIVFYNLENLFDTINDPEVLDDEFTPEGAKDGTLRSINKKLGQYRARALRHCRREQRLSAVIGVAEIENSDGAGRSDSDSKLIPATTGSFTSIRLTRGVDVAFFYRPDVFKIQGQKPFKADISNLSSEHATSCRCGNDRRRTLLLYGGSLAFAAGRKRSVGIETAWRWPADAPHYRLGEA